MKFTENQSKSINVNKGNYLIAAAAGSGKTAVLSNRVVRLLTEGDDDGSVSIDEIIVVTFTRASTSEMKNRINKILTEKIKESFAKIKELDDPIEKSFMNNKIEHYELQKLKLSNAKISTIDSLCSNLVKENFQSLGISSNMRTVTGVELDLLQSQVLEEVLETYYEKNDPEFLNLVENICITNDKELENMLQKGYSFIRSLPYPYDYLDEIELLYNKASVKDNIWINEIVKKIGSDIDLCIAFVNEALEIALDDEEIYTNYGKQLTDEKSEFEKAKEIFNNNNYEEALEKLSSIKYATAGRKACSNVEQRDNCKALRNKAKKLSEDSVKKHFPVFGNLDNDLKILPRIISSYFKLLKDFYKAFQDKKRELEVMDFSDILFYTLDLLSQTDDKGNYVQSSLAKALSNQYKYIIVDECQDINKVQNQIFNLLSRNEENIYMVGDVKQSIYRFRDASPEIFIEKKTSETSKTSTILLRENFRSRNVVCDIVNHIFEQLMSTDVGDIDYNEEEKLECGRNDYFEYPNAIPEFHIIDKQLEDDTNEKILVARHIAQTIKEMIDNKYQVLGEDGQIRDCDYKDFVILLRSRGVIETHLEELLQLGIPADCELQTEFFKDYDVSIALNLLKIINNPLDDIALLSVIMSPLFGFSADLVSKIRLSRKNSKLWVAIESLANPKSNDEDDETYLEYDKSCKEFIDLIAIFRKKSGSLSTTKLLQYIYDSTDFLALMSAKCDITKINLNMQLFLNYTKEYESFSQNGLAGFISYIAKLKDLKKDFEGITPPINESNTVKIITIHKSKGLEYPICFLSDCNREFNKMDLERNNYLFDNKLGIATKIVNHEKHSRYNPLPFEAIKQKIDKDGVSEELRVLYVALTRAKEKLIMVGSKNTTKSKCTCAKITEKLYAIAEGKITPEIVLKQKSFFDWLVISLLKNVDLSNVSTSKKFMIDKILDKKVRFCIVNSLLIGTKSETLDSVDIVDEIIKAPELDQDLIDTINKQINTTYPNKELTLIPTKTTVTKIAKANFAKESKIPIKLNTKLLFDNVKDENFVQEVTPAQKGTILHNFMQFANFENAIVNLEDEIQNLIDNKFLSKIQASHLDRNNIEQFLNSTTYLNRIAKEGNSLKREFAFNFNIPASMVDENLGSSNTNKVFTQGIADCLVFDQDGNITILDYKTDRIHYNETENDNLAYKERLNEQYKLQMLLYADALNNIFGENKVKDAYLYSLVIGQEIKIDIK